MASFVEQATLIVKDESSGPISKINAELKKLEATAKALKSTTINLNIKDSGLTKAVADIERLAAALHSIGNTKVNLTVNPAGLAAAQRQLAQLRAQAARPIPMPWGRTPGYGPTGPRIPPPRPPSGPVPVTAAGPGGPGFFRRTLGSAANLGLAMTGYATAHEIGKAIVEGTRQLDLGETSLRLKQLDRIYQTPGATEGALKLIDLIADQKGGLTGGGFLNRGQRTGLFSEAIGTATTTELGPTLRGATQLTSALEELVRTGVGLGQSFDAASDKAYAYAKAADAMGRLTYQQAETDQKGIFHPAGSFRTEGAPGRDTGMNNFFEYMQKLQPEIGREMTGTFVQSMAKYLASTKYAITNRGLGAVLLMGEDMGTRAAVGYSQAVKQLSGQQQTKEHLGNLFQLGLLQAHIERTGKKGKPKLIVEGPVDQEGLQRDLPKWVKEHIADNAQLMEQARKMFRPKGEAYDPANAADMAELASHLVGNRTAVESLTATLYNSAEIQRKLDTAEKRSARPEDIREATRDSVVLTTQKLNNQIEGAMGETVKAISPVLLPAMDFMAENMQSFGKTVRAATSTEDTPARTAARADILAGSITTGLAGVLGAKSYGIISSAFSTMMQPLGMAATLQGATSKDPSVRSLSIAGGVLLQAGNSLMSAATLMNSAAVTGMLAQLGPVGKAAATAMGVWQILPDEIKKNMTDSVRKLLGGETPEEATQRELNVKLNDLLTKRAELEKTLNEGSSDLQKRAARDQKLQQLNQGGKGAGTIPSTIDELNKQLEAVTKQIEDLKEKGAQPLIGGTREDPLFKRGSIGAEEANARMEAEIKRLEEAKAKTEREHEQSERTMSKMFPIVPSGWEAIPKPGERIPLPRPRDTTFPVEHRRARFRPDEEVPLPRPDPRKVQTQPGVPFLLPGLPLPKELMEAPPPGSVLDIMRGGGSVGTGATDSPILQQFRQLQEAGATVQTAMATPAEAMKAAADSLAQAGSTTAASLESGASSLITAGATAASTISAGASAAGAAYGSAAAAKIASAVANVNINVNTSGGGGSKPDTGTKPMAA